MVKELDRYIDPGFVYDFSMGPDRVPSRDAALVNGINCVSLAHLALKELFDHELPSNLFCLEMFLDREQFDPVPPTQPLQVGDLVWFGPDKPKVPLRDFVPVFKNGQLINWGTCPIKHVGVCTGETTQQAESLILHASREVGSTAVWPLGRFGKYRRYAGNYGATRLRGAPNLLAAA